MKILDRDENVFTLGLQASTLPAGGGTGTGSG